MSNVRIPKRKLFIRGAVLDVISIHLLSSHIYIFPNLFETATATRYHRGHRSMYSC
jgi:hypothetical protein